MTKLKQDIYQQVTNEIVKILETGVKPWEKPWKSGIVCRPIRHNGLAYTGVNVLMLWMVAEAKGYEAPIWMTYKQAIELGGQVKKGEKGALVIYANSIVIKEESEEEETRIPYTKSYNVFNVQQIEGLPEKYYIKPEVIFSPKERIEQAQNFFNKTGAVINHGGNRAYYSPSKDKIQMPEFEKFNSAESYTTTLCHELTHWTGHKDRLNRLNSKILDKESYASEELIAEIGSAFLCADLSIKPMLENHASYIDSWLKVLRNDKRAIFKASAQAEKAVSFLQSLQK